DSFQYTITDSDGDSVTATAYVNVAGDRGLPALDANAYVDDDGLAGGNPAGDGSNGGNDQDNGEPGAGVGDESVWTGSLGTPTGEAISPLTYTLVDPGAGPHTVGQENVTYELSGGGTLLTAKVAAGEDRA